MFFKSDKKKKKSMLETGIREIDSKISKILRLLEQQNDKAVFDNDKIFEQNTSILKALRGQTDSLEDFLDEQNQLDKIQRETEQKLKKMACLVGKKSAQLYQIKQQLINDPDISDEVRQAWTAQFQMMDDMLKKETAECEIYEFGNEGDSIDFEMVEILKVIDTDDLKLKGTIARVNERGYMYQGKIIKKAIVEAYR
ncbi:MAG: nucleotide exchange factor GrpE [Lachnospiraceae bacterium]|nr:nucleotide exchange factor GrpE [Lachnospiraceae bacterium]